MKKKCEITELIQMDKAFVVEIDKAMSTLLCFGWHYLISGASFGAQ